MMKDKVAVFTDPRSAAPHIVLSPIPYRIVVSPIP